MTYAPSGGQYEISRGDQRATIVEVGGGLRRYAVGDRDVLHPYDLTQICDGAHGAPLIPWPNRLADGQYRFDGQDYQVALTEPDKHNAIHGFLRWRLWTPVQHSEDRVVMACRLLPSTGYPFALDIRVAYALTSEGLAVTTTVVNVGDRAAPYGSGQHPYLSPGEGLIDDCVLYLDADTRILTDPTRQLPSGTETVAGTAFDFRSGRRLGELKIDHAFTDLSRDSEGRAWLRLQGTDGRVVALWVDESYPLLQVYTADTLKPERQRCGLGAEPMTCPPNAFRTGDGLVRLEPGDTFSSSWGVVLV